MSADLQRIPCLRPEECPAHQPVLDALHRCADAIASEAKTVAALEAPIKELHSDVKSVKALLMVDEGTGKMGVLPRLDLLEREFAAHVADSTKSKDFKLSATLQLVMLILAPVVSTIIGVILYMVAYTHWIAPAAVKAVAP